MLHQSRHVVSPANCAPRCVSFPQASFFLLVLAAYVFMLRVPSEALPAVIVSSQQLDDFKRSKRTDGRKKIPPMVCITESQVEWFFWRRKNKFKPSSIFRACWCASCKKTCPVHVLGAYLQTHPVGARPFGEIREVGVRACLPSGRRVCRVAGKSGAHATRPLGWDGRCTGNS